MKKLTAIKPVFYLSTGLISCFLLLGVFFPTKLKDFFNSVQGGITEYFGWFYILSMTGFLIIALYIITSPVGKIRLGSDDSRPEFSNLSWFSMLFSAGMGIGLLFYGIAEPIMHFNTPAPPVERGGSLNAARNAMGLTLFHWGLHPWACYSLIGLSLAYFSFRKGLPLSIRSALYPVLGERFRGWPGHLIDSLAIVSTLFGVATSLGLGVMQVNSGLNYVVGLPNTVVMQVGLIAFITGLATWSVVSGLDKGIRILSEGNLIIASILLLFVFFNGPIFYLLNSFVENLGIYLQTLPVNSFWTSSLEDDRREWLGNWTIFYWAWWIAWSPFVGMFIARISRGRTIRQFMVTVLVAPTLMSIVWFTVMGNSALYMEMFGVGGLSEAVSENISTSLFVFLDKLPFSMITSTLGILCVTLFFVTSSDSASLVIDTIASSGALNPPVWQRVFWAILEGLVAIILLLAGGLQALQTGSITTALPFTLIILVVIYGLLRSLRQENSKVKKEMLSGHQPK